MKKTNPFKMYSLKSVGQRIGVSEDKIESFLEEKKTIGKKLGNFWFVRGREILKIEREIGR